MLQTAHTFKSAGYSTELIDEYMKGSQSRFQKEYDILTRATRKPVTRGKRRRPANSDSESSEGVDYDEFDDYIRRKHDKTITDTLGWWKNSQTMFPKLLKMARDVMSVPAAGVGVETEFSISGRVIRKQCNRLEPWTIQDLMQYKH